MLFLGAYGAKVGTVNKVMEVAVDAQVMMAAVAEEVPLVDGDTVVTGWKWEEQYPYWWRWRLRCWTHEWLRMAGQGILCRWEGGIK